MLENILQAAKDVKLRAIVLALRWKGQMRGQREISGFFEYSVCFVRILGNIKGVIVTYIPSSNAAITAALAAIAARNRKEEEQMTGYNKGDLEGWEFKIVRSGTNKFRSQEVVRQVCDEEARSGWELVEKFDDARMRFKRRVERRSGDQHAEIDPYRTSVGFGGKATGAIIGGILALLGLGLLAAFYAAR